MSTDPEWAATYQRILGDELRIARKIRKWTRKQLLKRLGIDISLQTLATYELGTRSIPRVRLVQITMALETDLLAVLGRVFGRLDADTQRAAGWAVDLTAASTLDDPDLTPLRRWARSQLLNTPMPNNRPKIVRLDLHAMDNLAGAVRHGHGHVGRPLTRSGTCPRHRVRVTRSKVTVAQLTAPDWIGLQHHTTTVPPVTSTTPRQPARRLAPPAQAWKDCSHLRREPGFTAPADGEEPSWPEPLYGKPQTPMFLWIVLRRNR